MKVTLNGPAGAGKGTISRAIATITGLPYVDLGLVFRFTAYALHEDFCSDVPGVVTLIQSRRMVQKWDGHRVSVLFDELDVTKPLHESKIALEVARLSSVEKNLKAIAMVLNTLLEGYDDLICDGKSAGTAVLPNADYKFYVTADEEERARRRFKDLVARQFDVSYEQILKDVHDRDQLDMQRAYDPLRAPENACIIDTTNLPVEESIKIIRGIIKR